MRNERLMNAFGQEPEAFAARIDQTLRSLEEEESMKRFTLRTAMAALLVLMLLCGIAYAVVSQGMEWYYSNRFTAYQQYEPEKHQAILGSLQAVQTQEGMPDPLVSVEVREAAWTPEHNVLVISLAATPVDPDKAELHPEWNLDADGSYVGEKNLSAYADDPEARAEHWLWTNKGFGPVRDVMDDSAKELLLFSANDVYLGSAADELSMMGDGSSVDCYMNGEGEVMTVIEASLDWLHPSYAHQEGIDQAAKMRERMAQQKGVLSISVPYTIVTYSDDDEVMQNSRYMKCVTFEISIP